MLDSGNRMVMGKSRRFLEIASISVFRDQVGADDTNQRASAWVKQSLGDIVAGPLEARAGEVLVNASA